MELARLILPFIVNTPAKTAGRLLFLFPVAAEEIACRHAVRGLQGDDRAEWHFWMDVRKAMIARRIRRSSAIDAPPLQPLFRQWGSVVSVASPERPHAVKRTC
ncbi:hypothetical protein [Neoasaia chiangmaiensis]|nr:hypothetical protein [Neoasaia chiangmaiensis]